MSAETGDPVTLLVTVRFVPERTSPERLQESPAASGSQDDDQEPNANSALPVNPAERAPMIFSSVVVFMTVSPCVLQSMSPPPSHTARKPA